MNIGILGSGSVGQSLAEGFLGLGHGVRIGTRTPEKLAEWLSLHAGSDAAAVSPKEAAAFGDLVVLAVKWAGGAAEHMVELAGKDNFRGKIVIDVTNPLVFREEGKPPELALGYPDSAGKTVQSWLPDAKVVKAFNIITAGYMTNPKMEEGKPDMFIAGNDSGAKGQVTDFAEAWGWTVQDLGGIDQAYLLESLAMVWIRWGFLNNHWTHGFALLKK